MIRSTGETLSVVEQEMLTMARAVGEPVALLLGGDIRTLVSECADFGCKRVLIAQSLHHQHGLSVAADCIAQVVSTTCPTCVLIAHSVDAQEIAGRVAVRTGSAVFTDISGVATSQDHGVIVTQEVFGGTTIVQSTARTPTLVATVRAHSTEPSPRPATAVTEHVECLLEDSTRQVTVTVGERPQQSTRPPITEASIVVSAGRGVGERADYEQLVEPLADLLNAAIGASRAAIDNEWCGRDLLVGQSGHTISPDLYLALGISGAIHHRAGMQNAKHVIAINTDADAPMITKADLGVVGDVREIVPQLIALLSGH